MKKHRVYLLILVGLALFAAAFALTYHWTDDTPSLKASPPLPPPPQEVMEGQPIPDPTGTGQSDKPAIKGKSTPAEEGGPMLDPSATH